MPDLLFYLLYLSLFFVTNSNGYSLNTTTTTCPMFSCGNGVTIRYPFWEINIEHPDYCGYSQFGLSCSPATREPMINISNYSYYVKNINYSDYTLTLVDADIVDLDCPRARHNISLDTVPLKYSPYDLKLTFYFNCTGPSEGLLSHIECLGSGNGGRRSYVGMMERILDGYDGLMNCEETVVTTVMERKIDTNDLTGGFGVAMKEGFMLNWRTVTECGACENNGGRCGYSSYTTKRYLCYCKNGDVSFRDCEGSGFNLPLKLVIVVCIGGAIIPILFISIAICCFRRKVSSNNLLVSWKRNRKNYHNVEAFIRKHGCLAPKRYSYSDIKKITNSLKDKLGQGGFGGVYKGKMPDGRLVAVKVLKESKGNGEEFINEVASISRTSHVNVVTLLGFCFEGHKRALIYEFMPNGSLEKFIYDGSQSVIDARNLGWEKLYQIAIGIARGLEYLHVGCNTRILHFDIKPHNILLDGDFCPKIADFGLAKLCTGKESIISMLGARGTIGYIAPEVYNRNFGGVSHKSDVYSYGSMILEMVGGRKNIDVGVSQTNKIYFPHWVYNRLELDKDYILEGVMTEEENKIARKMILVGLWCIQTDPSQRPSISKVMEMLEGSTEALQIPPKPFISSPPKTPANSSTPSTTFHESTVCISN